MQLRVLLLTVALLPAKLGLVVLMLAPMLTPMLTPMLAVGVPVKPPLVLMAATATILALVLLLLLPRVLDRCPSSPISHHLVLLLSAHSCCWLRQSLVRILHPCFKSRASNGKVRVERLKLTRLNLETGSAHASQVKSDHDASCCCCASQAA